MTVARDRAARNKKFWEDLLNAANGWWYSMADGVVRMEGDPKTEVVMFIFEDEFEDLHHVTVTKKESADLGTYVELEQGDTKTWVAPSGANVARFAYV
jgi:hypothetical protein